MRTVHHEQPVVRLLALQPVIAQIDGVQQLEHVRAVQRAAILQLAHLDLPLVLLLVVHELERDGRGVLPALAQVESEDDEAGGGAVDFAIRVDAEAAEEEAVGVGPIPDLSAAEGRELVCAQPVQQRLARLREQARASAPVHDQQLLQRRQTGNRRRTCSSLMVQT